MLARLQIDNLAVVESVELRFGPGLNVLTGSTGAGKSLVMGAVTILTGERVSPDLIRQGADEARVEATFTGLPAGPLPGLATTPPGGSIVLQRRVSRGGRSHAFIDGHPATIRDLRAACACLLEPHGQNEQFRLRNPETHVDYVDALASNQRERERYAEALAAFATARADLERFDAETALAREQRELFQHRIDDLARVEPRAGEKGELENTARLMANAEKIHAALADACAALFDDDAAAATAIGRARTRLAAIARIDDRIVGIEGALDQAAELVAGAAGDARAIIDGLEFEPADVERVQERLDALARLERRYQTTIEVLLEQAEEWKRALDGLADAAETRRRYEHALDERARVLAAAGESLSETRRIAAKHLGERVTATLQRLGMRGAELRAEVAPQPDESGIVHADGRRLRVFENGLDVVRLRVRTNPGEAEGPVEVVASTGELSRVALALKQCAPAATHSGATLILDEIDAGVGADLGVALAENLLALSDSHQIVCITHMPQIAACGASHLVVHKVTDGDRTRVSVRTVDGDERTREVARMLGGEEGSSKRLALAGELLEVRSPNRRESRVRP